MLRRCDAARDDVWRNHLATCRLHAGHRERADVLPGFMTCFFNTCLGVVARGRVHVLPDCVERAEDADMTGILHD